MKIALIHGQNHKGSSYMIGRMLADSLADEGDIAEFFLPRALDHFCLGCCACIKDESKCPFHGEKAVLEEAMERAELLIFTTPTYCMEMSAPLKSFIDLFFQYWLPHRPRKHMFSKKAVVISTAAGAGTRQAIAPVKRTLAYWGVPYIRGYGKVVSSAGWEQVPDRIKTEIEKDVAKLAERVKRAKAGKPSLFIRFMFALMKSEKKKAADDDFFINEKQHWEENGWLDGVKPWSKPAAGAQPPSA